MSLFYTVTLEGHKGEEHHDIEITQDGELVVPGYDLAWDDMLSAMGGQRSAVRDLLDGWAESPTDIICTAFGVGEREIVKLAVDWAEHVLPIFESQHGEDLRFRKALQKSRGFLGGKNTLDDLITNEPPYLGVARRRYAKKDRGGRLKLAAKDAGMAVKYAHSATKNLAHQTPWDDEVGEAVAIITSGEILSMSLAAATEARNAARAFVLAERTGHPDATEIAEAAEAAEASWQVRHFVHAMECSRDRLPWPGIEETR